ncbi:MAG: transcriptional regulator GcvA [Alphaproteobacteria bacterium]|nr:transcriptional regulator GcvA [Alphaproteobacteria bacterium]MBV8409426.1 transcriptional regulator GcvA [Alphaproteobacteria bacterium]
MIGERLPPLNALRAFEAAARHLSVKEAASELCVTPGAVSQMVKALELRLGVVLFNRMNRRLTLTDAGQSYLPAVRNAFRQIAEATGRLATHSETGLLSLSTTPFFANAWLVPRLKSFQQAHPDIDLQITTSNSPIDLTRSGIDVAIRHGLGRYAGLRSERVLTLDVVPVATRELVEQMGMPACPSDLALWPLVHDAERQAWHRWFGIRGVSDLGVLRGPSFDDPTLLLKAVLAGQGAGLLPAALIASEVDRDHLVKLADAAWIEDLAYYLVYPAASRDRPKIAAFRRWITSAR